MVSETQTNLTVAVTGVTGTLGLGLMPLLEADDRVAHVTGVARHPFDPAAHGWTKTKYLRGDVRDAEMLREAFRHADVVVHLAFQVTGAVPGESIESVNIGGTLNAFDAAAAVGARRFVFASSVAAYGFHRDNPIGMTEDWPTRPAARLFYGQEKARLEHLLQARATTADGPALYLLRPSIVLGPHAVGAKSLPHGRAGTLARVPARWASRMPFPVPVPELPVQFVHEADVGQALLQCVVAAGPPGTYNIAADGIVTATHGRARVRHAVVPRFASPDSGRGPGPRRAALPPARRAVGGGGQPSGDHGHYPGERGTRLGPEVHRARDVAGDGAPVPEVSDPARS